MKGRLSGHDTFTNAMKSSSSSSSHRPRITCNCGEEVLLLMSSTKANPGKTFWRCPNWKSSQSCNFFRWCDEETGKDEVQKRLELEIANLEFKISKLRRKLMEERAVRRLMAIVITISWALTVGLCIFSSIKCVVS